MAVEPIVRREFKKKQQHSNGELDGWCPRRKKKNVRKKKLGINPFLLKIQRLHMAMFCQQDNTVLLILMNLCRLPLSESPFRGEFCWNRQMEPP